MRLLLLILWLVVPLMALQSHAQEEQADPYSVEFVRFEIRMRSGEASVRHGFSQRQLARLGDGISVALTKILDEQQMVDPGTLGVILPMIREAFSQPALITIKANRQPQVTLLLLEHIRRKVTDRGIYGHIDETTTSLRNAQIDSVVGRRV